MKKITITKNEADQRLDRFLSKYLNNTTRSNIYKLIRKKVFKVNGNRIKDEDYFLKEGDTLEIYLADDTLKGLIKPIKIVKPDESGLDIVYEDDDILVVNKPKGMLTHPDKEEYKNTLATIVQFYLKHLCTATFRPAPVHRLDKNTSGLILFAKNYEALKYYNDKMRERDVQKYYLCVVEGQVDPSGEIKGYLLKDESTNKVALSQKEKNNSKFCHTKYRLLKYSKGVSLVEVELLTGRSHQIRVSMAYLGHPIVGDVKYGGHKRKGMTTQLLHAYKLVVDGKIFEQGSAEIEDFVK